MRVLLFFDKLYKVLKSKHWGVWVSKTFSLFKLIILFPYLNLVELSVLMYGTTALLFLRFFFKFFNKLIEKLGLAASWINTFLNFLWDRIWYSQIN